ncbi:MULTISPECIES: NAD(P)H-dependent oxidoreductase [unclassified Pseudoalteromonas]|uniref:NADPH-dependent FMN reductase n=1 Tax=unclassified Pseudoalteromonas TaxID=194690 RepID=UPI001408A808|nr:MULTISPECIES: NAD(P)H-dependent oxidoreductase [unclassified Pseudoalteromonas]MBH0077128.1 NAD(P)H-dependent oxidoreductase [Pseudoalteromonas sp. SWYJ118]
MKFLVFLGTVRDSTPPKPARLGLRVSSACIECLTEHFGDHEFELIDTLDFPSENVFKPHFAYAKSNAPTELTLLADKIKAADGYIMISPEYNHSMSPALADLLNHFGSSLFSYKPSAIVTYSAGQWGGVRAAISMRTFLSELGCLPVSAMIHVPKAQDVFSEDGKPVAGESQSSWFNYFSRTFSQLIWWAQAAKKHTEVVDPQSLLKSFKTAPSQRNAP